MQKLLNVAILLLIVSCAPRVESVMNPPISFADNSQYKFKVRNIEFVDNYQQKIEAPHVEHLMPYSMNELIRTWTNEKVVASGGNGTLRVVLREASMVEVPLPKKKDFRSKFEDQQSEVYKARLEVAFELFGDDPLFPKLEGKVSLHASETIAESASINNRDKLYYDIEKRLINGFETEADKLINGTFSNLLTYD